MASEDDRLLTTAQLSERLQVSESTLRRWRTEGTGPSVVRVGRAVRYRWRDVERWLEAGGQASE
jgi:excisionase family DNA binding protein